MRKKLEKPKVMVSLRVLIHDDFEHLQKKILIIKIMVTLRTLITWNTKSKQEHKK